MVRCVINVQRLTYKRWYNYKFSYLEYQFIVLFWTYSGLIMMARTSITWKVFTACLVAYTGLFVQTSSSLSCDPSAEHTDLKAYRSPIVAEGTLNGTLASVQRKTLKGKEFSKRITQIQLTGFETESPCIGPASSFSQGTKYMIFLNETDPGSGSYSLVGNPVKTSSSAKRDVRKVEKDGEY